MLLKNFWYEPAKHLYRLVFFREYRTWSLLASRLARRSRYSAGEVKLEGKSFRFPDAASFVSGYKEIFVQRIYEFQPLERAPRVLDLGANIGLSVLFFKKHYPDAKITAFEADPEVFKYLQYNISQHGYDDIRLINQAAWNQDDSLTFHSEGSDGGSIYASGNGRKVEVTAIDIRQHLADNQYDFLKMDIEGAEDVVLPACIEYLQNFRYVFVEYHSRVNTEQSLAMILDILRQAGLRVNIQAVMTSPKPFSFIYQAAGFDLQLNIFAYRPSVHV